MKRTCYISAATQARIIREYKQKNPDDTYTWLLKEIAEHHDVSLSTVNNLAKMAGCQARPRGGRIQGVPNPRIMKILRDASEPFITLERVGELNPRVVMVNKRPKEIPLTRQRVSQIIRTWKSRLKGQRLHSKGFKPGDKIEWSDQEYVVLSYDSSHRGAVLDLADNKVIDPFCWVFKGSRSKCLLPSTEELAEEAAWKRYVGCDRATHAERVRAERAKEAQRVRSPERAD
jgi:hypothetical protein